MLKFFGVILIFSQSVGTLHGQKISVTANKDLISLSAIRGTTSRTDTLVLNTSKRMSISDFRIIGEQALYFKFTLLKDPTSTSTKIVLQFIPPSSFIGIARATFQNRNGRLSVGLLGLSTKALEGENEPPLSSIIECLGLKANVGWTTLANHLRPELQGDELPPSLFRKASPAAVEMIPVARYSPDFPLNFGYYVQTARGPNQYHAGILAKSDKIPEHQTLYPALAQGKNSFDPGDQDFGFYAISPEHTLYSEDIWNMVFYPTHASHATRIYPVKDISGKLIANTYLLCMEEAANGDYNDYVFLVKNVRPIGLNEKFTTIFNGENLDGWKIWLQGQEKNADPDKNFTIQDGLIFDSGKDPGYIITDKSYGNYHFTLEFKWGEKKWPPRENAKRDSGICYNIPDDEADQIWPKSIECQIQEGDVGDFWLLNYATIQVDGKQNPPEQYSRIAKKRDAEKAEAWNTVEVISYNGTCVHIVNGVLVNCGKNASLVGGRILLQSEFAEIYYKNIKIREL